MKQTESQVPMINGVPVEQIAKVVGNQVEYAFSKAVEAQQKLQNLELDMIKAQGVVEEYRDALEQAYKAYQQSLESSDSEDKPE